MMRILFKLLSPLSKDQLIGKQSAIRRMEAIRQQARVTFCREFLEGDEFQSSLSKLREFMNDLRSEDVNLDESLLTSEGHPAPVTYVDILDDPFVTISMFVLRPGQRLPFHDHPSMYGLCKVVRGTVRIQSYTVLPDAHQSKSVMVIGKKEEDVFANEESQTVLLTPYERNIHEISAFDGPAAFVDVLSPPYETNQGIGPRPCSYFVEVNPKNEPGSINRLLKTNKSGGYWTDYAPYLGP